MLRFLRYPALAAFILALGLGAYSGNAQPPQPEGPAPGKLPDVLGITTGMPAQQALDLLRANDPGHTAAFMQFTFPQIYGSRPIVTSMNTATSGAGGVEVQLTVPPLQQLVWSVHRSIPQFTGKRADIVNELTQKYGTQVWVPGPNPPPGTMITWLFDETGQPVNPPNQADKYKMRDCLGMTGQSWNMGTPVPQALTNNQVVQGGARTQVVQPNPVFDPAVHHVCDNVVVVFVGLLGQDQPPQWKMSIDITDVTLQHRAAKVLNDQLNAAVQKGPQR